MHNVIVCEASVAAPPAETQWHPSAVASLVLDADTIPQADGSQVAAWNSTGSNASYSAAQATAANQPMLVKNALGGRAVVHFDGNQWLTLNYHAGASGFSLILLVILTGGSYPMMLVYDHPATAYEMRGNGASGTWQYIIGGAGSITTDVNAAAWVILEGIFRKAEDMAYAYYNGNLWAPPSAITPTLNPDGIFWVGRREDNYALVGSVACGIAVAADLSDSDRQKIEGWIAHRWGQQALLPAGHPYKLAPPTVAPVQDYTLYAPTVVPTIVAVGPGSAYVVGTDFLATIPGKITAIRFWKDSNDTASTHTAAIWTSDGSTNLSGNLTSSGETASGWQQINLPSPLSITPNTLYTAGVLYSAGCIMYEHLAPTAAGVLQNQLYRFLASSTLAFPSNTQTANCYFIDVVFQG